MHKLCKIIEQEQLEIEAAEDYIACAAKSEGNTKSLYRELAKDELEHVSKLLQIGDERKFEKDSKEAIIWNFEKERILDKHSRLTSRLSQVR